MRRKRYRWHSQVASHLCLEESTDDPEDAIRKRAARLLDEAQISGPPTRLDLLASLRDIIDVEPVQMSGAGRLFNNGRGNVVQVNKDHSFGKRNFTIAHEISHTLLPGYSKVGAAIFDSVTGDYARQQEGEFLCDIGASSLIFDPRWLKPAASTLGPSINSLLRLSKDFAASIQATAVALANLSLWPFAVIFLEEGWRRNEGPTEAQQILTGFEKVAFPEPELRIRFCSASQSFKTFIPRNKSVDRSSSIYRCFKNECTTKQIEDMDFGKLTIRCYVESLFAPYRHDRICIKRVVSTLLAYEQPSVKVIENPENYVLEFL